MKGPDEVSSVYLLKNVPPTVNSLAEFVDLRMQPYAEDRRRQAEKRETTKLSFISTFEWTEN